MAINFPNNPVVNQQFVAAGYVYIFDGNMWKKTGNKFPTNVSDFSNVDLTGIESGDRLYKSNDQWAPDNNYTKFGVSYSNAWKMRLSSDFTVYTHQVSYYPTWDVVEYDFGGGADTTNGRYYVPQSGWWFVVLRTKSYNTRSGGNKITGLHNFIQIDGSTIQDMSYDTNGFNPTYYETVSSSWLHYKPNAGSALIYVNAGQYIRPRIYCWEGTNKVIKADKNTYFSGVLIS